MKKLNNNDANVYSDQPDDKPTCIQRIKKSKLYTSIFEYEHAKEIRRFPIGLKDPILRSNYAAYRHKKTHERLIYACVFLTFFTVFKLILTIVGSPEMRAVKLGRDAIHFSILAAAVFFHSKFKYAV